MTEVQLQTAKSEQGKDWKVLEFYVPITESLSEGEDFLIKGVAINETTTLNNVKYVAEELQKAAPSFRNVPILLDHKNEVKNIVGRTTENVNWNSTSSRIDFEAKIMDNGIKEMIKDGRIGSVSIGAKVTDLTEEDDGSMKAIGIRGLEISLVAVPGDSHANLAQALQNSFHLKEMAELKGAKKVSEELNTDGGKNMSEETKVEQEAPEEAKEEAKDEAVEAPAVEAEEAPAEEVAAEEKATNITVNMDNSELTEMKSQIKELKELLVAKKELKEQAEEEDETKGEVSEETAENLGKVSNLIVEKSQSGFALYRDYNKEGSESNLKRLAR